MLEARKENKVYKVDETQKKRYLSEGFDIYDEKGEIVEHSPLKVIKYNEHLKIVAKVVEEKDAQIKALADMNKAPVAEDVTALLKIYAEEKGIDIGSSTAATGILEKILKAEKTEE
jgi:hypothetical protein